MEERLKSLINSSTGRFSLPDGVSSVEFKVKENQEIKIKCVNDVKAAKPYKPLPRTPNQRPPSTFGEIPLPIVTSQIILSNTIQQSIGRNLSLNAAPLSVHRTLSADRSSVLDRNLSSENTFSDNLAPLDVSFLKMINEPQYILEPTGRPSDRSAVQSPKTPIATIEDVVSEETLSSSDEANEVNEISEVKLSNIIQRKPHNPSTSPREVSSPKKENSPRNNPNLIVLSKGPTSVGPSSEKKENRIVRATKKLPKFLRDKMMLPLHKLSRHPPKATSPPTSPRSPGGSDMTISAADIKKLNAASLNNLRKINRAGPLPKIISVAITALDDKGRQVPLPEDIAAKLPFAINSVIPRDIPVAVQQGGQGGVAKEVSVDLTNSEGKKEKLRIKQCSIM